MKILVVCQYYYPEPFRISDICEELVKRGHEVTVVTGVPNYPEGIIYDGYRGGKKRKEIINGVEVHRCFTIGRRAGTLFRFLNYYSFAISSYLYVSGLKRRKKVKPFDVVFVNQLSPVMMAYAGILAKKKWNIPLVMYCLDLWPESLVAGGVSVNSIIYRLFKTVSRNIYKKADAIAITSRQFEKYFQEVLEIETENMVLLPQYAEDIFEDLQIEKRDKVGYDFVFAGNIGEMQSVETIIQAARLIEANSNESVRIHIVGDGSKLECCKKLAKGLENAKFYGRRPIEDMPKFYAMADAMLITLKSNKSISYTLPGKIQSYMAAGKPIIGAIDGETKLVIEEARCGYCCEAENEKQLANLIVTYIKSAHKEEMGDCSRKYYEEHYKKNVFMKHLNQLLGKQSFDKVEL